jgi:serralysin
MLHGGSGNDELTGGAGIDTLIGRQGADRFIASDGTNYVMDFSTAQSDAFEFAGTTEHGIVEAVTLWLTGDASSSGIAIDTVQHLGDSGLSITDLDGDNLVLMGMNPYQFLAAFGDL